MASNGDAYESMAEVAQVAAASATSMKEMLAVPQVDVVGIITCALPPCSAYKTLGRVTTWPIEKSHFWTGTHRGRYMTDEFFASWML